MPDPRRNSVLCLSATGFHRMAYLEWGIPTSERTAVCVHGLTGNARDFEDLAQALADEGWRVVCPDVVGRGESEWLRDPEGYGLRQYRADLAVLIGRLRVDTVDWIGTSMGGLIGMTLAALPQTPVRRLVLNDIGPLVPHAALLRLESTLRGDPTFEDLGDAERWLRSVRAPVGPLSDEQWRRMTERAFRTDDDGVLRRHYDPRLAGPFARTSGRDLDLWSTWDRLRCPVLVLRGERSDLLLQETAESMSVRGPAAEVHEVQGCGHAPALMEPAQIELVTAWLGRASG